MTLFIFGTGGHAKVIADIVEKQNAFKTVAFIDEKNTVKSLSGYPVILQKDLAQDTEGFAIVAIGDNFTRKIVAEKIIKSFPHLRFTKAIHPTAQIASNVHIGAGTVVMANATINPDSNIEEHCIVNTSSSLDHDCKMESYSSVAPGVITGGNVSIGTMSAIGIGSIISHGKSIAKNTVIGAGSLVIQDIPEKVVAYGSPAKVVRTRAENEPYLN